MQLSFLAQNELYLVIIENKTVLLCSIFLSSTYYLALPLMRHEHTVISLYPEALAASIARIALSKLPRQKRFDVIGICLHPILCIL